MARRVVVSAGVLGVVLATILVVSIPQSGHGQAAGERVIYLAAIEPKGGVTVDKESYPAAPLPKGGGYVLNPPNPQGRWEVSVYQWSPSTIVVRQGERVTLEIVGINGAKHSGHIDKYHPDHFEVKRGQITRVQFTADTPGIFKIHCKEHEPSMEGTLVVLPR
jgi:FtsP/CotA-like multicopper oxidase with cupredoxin domain